MNDAKHIIHILPDYIANQIAAGEVVQRPESVVKELVENSLDAGAKEIGVFVRDAGKQLIHIIDNGSGMCKEDLEMSIKRHSTSKIFTQEDLEAIKSFGFRGEALASICSVASVEIRTKTASDSHGWKLITEPMKPIQIEPCFTDKGTQIFVRNLFFNVPARRKFLRSNLTEFRYISETMFKFALSHPEIAFTFYDADTLIFNLKPSSLFDRITSIFNRDIKESLINVKYENELIKINGFVGSPQIAKLNQTVQYLFLNRRNIRSKSLSHAIISAYEHIIEKNSYPFYILNIEINPNSVDVNVHPQKYEVKFDDERMVYGFVNKAISHALQNYNYLSNNTENFQISQNPISKVDNDISKGPDNIVLINKLTGEILDNNLKNKENFSSIYHSSPRESSFGNSFQYKKVNFEILNKDKDIFQIIPNDNSNLSQANFDKHNILSTWQAHNKYIFVQTQNSIIIIDQHAAHERILYEKALKAMSKEFSYSQELLFPVEISLNFVEMSALKEIENDIQNLGFYYGIKSQTEVTLYSVPNDIKSGEEEIAFKTILSEYVQNQKVSSINRIDSIAATFSCKSAIKTGQKLTSMEIEKLINDLFECQMPHVCPHGRPIIIDLSINELDKRFHRT